MDPTQPDFHVPASIGRYVELRLLGRGGMGAVYRGRDPELDRPVAIKVMLHSTPDFIARFRREAQAIAKLTHGNVVQVYDFGVDDQANPYFVMELIEGTPLDQVLAQRGRLPPEEAIEIAKQAAQGLAAAHRAGLIHRDVKPSNLIIDTQHTVKLVDFGIARATASAQLTTAASLMGTPGYMSPEQAQGKPVDHRADIYALGLTLFEMLAGEPPFYAEDPIALVVMNMQEPLPDLRQRGLGLTEDLIALVEKMAQKAPNDRVQTCDDVVLALDSLGVRRRPSVQQAVGPLVQIPPTNVGPLPVQLTPPPSAVDTRPRGLALALGAALAVSGIGVGVVMLMSKHRDTTQQKVADVTTPPTPKSKDPLVAPTHVDPPPPKDDPTKLAVASEDGKTAQMAVRPKPDDGPLRVAVLKFQNLSHDASLDALAEGIGETSVNSMVGVAQGRLAVIERNDIDSDIGEIDRGKDEHFDKATVAQAGKLEGVHVAVQGAFQRSGKVLRVTARFVRVQTGEILDVVRYDGHSRDPLDLEDAVAKELRGHIVALVDKERPLGADAKGKAP